MDVLINDVETFVIALSLQLCSPNTVFDGDIY